MTISTLGKLLAADQPSDFLPELIKESEHPRYLSLTTFLKINALPTLSNILLELQRLATLQEEQRESYNEIGFERFIINILLIS
jgi:hypothetical protein